MKSEILKKIEHARRALNQLGSKRETVAEQSRYLTEISMRFQHTTDSALSASYFSSDWFDTHITLRFATEVVNRNEALSALLAKDGDTYDFHDDCTKKEGVDDKAEVNADLDDNDEKEKKVQTRTTDDDVELEELMVNLEISSKKAEKTDILKWLKEVYEHSRGFELGTFDGSILAMTMKTQSSKWEAIALGYMSDIVSMAHKFIKILLSQLCPDERVKDGLLPVLMERLMAKYRTAFDHVRFLLHVERMGTPATMNLYFSGNLEKR